MHITVIGTGYVGLVTGACLAEFGMNVLCVDLDVAKIAALNRGEMPIYEPGLEELVGRNVAQKRLAFSTDFEQGVAASLVIFIAVGTPPAADGSADLGQVRAVAADIGRFMNSYKVIVDKSTVPVGTGQMVKEVVSENQSTKVNFDVVSNPEFLREGSAIGDFMRPDRVVVGAESEQAAAIMKDIYNVLYLNETAFVLTNIETAELIKYAANAFLATKISFINEVANLCEKVGANVQQVARGIGLDGRIGKKFLHAGPGYGGSCFPKDTLAMAATGRQHKEPLTIVEAVIAVNQRQRQRMVEKVVALLDGAVKGKTVALLGLAFKPETDDVRDAPALYFAKALREQGAMIRAYDPEAVNAFKELCADDEIFYATDAYEAAVGADILVLMTEWNQFRYLDLERLHDLMTQPIFADLRNVYDGDKLRASGFIYAGVGRK
ncbi:MAG: UDP-glucose/GDP-mannose dehydrogenase family protein [Deltaproteobacteria bacterium]|nr:UDP-glucose/GDP-mannose dehydrogenase family protein [Deltaproteobacteria bacterium]